MHKSKHHVARIYRSNPLLHIGIWSSLLIFFSLLLTQVVYAAVDEESNLTIQLFDGIQNNSPMADTQITIKELLSDGTKKWHKKTTTDSIGQASVFLEGLGEEGRTFILYVRNSFNNKYKTLSIDSAGSHEFTVGTPLLEVTLRDTETGETFSDVEVSAYQVVEGVKDKYLSRAKTDAEGVVKLDLPILSEDGTVRLKAKKVYNNLDSYSPLITQSGNFDFLLARMRVAVLDGRNDEALANQEVKIYTQAKIADAEREYYGKAITDASGELRLSPKYMHADGTTDVNYIFKTKSPFNNKYKYSTALDQVGDHTFYVGGTLLSVTLRDGSHNDAVIANTEIKAYRLLSNGKRKRFATATTNEQGLVEFDVPDLAEGNTTVQLTTRVFNEKFLARSQNITELGEVDFTLATTIITVKDGSMPDGEILANHKVNLREVKADGESKGIANLETDAQGQLRLTLPALGDKKYILRAKNPHPAITKNKFSSIISSEGNHIFAVGTQLLNISLVDAINDTGIADKKVSVYLERGDMKPKYLGKITTDSTGMGFIDIPLLASSEEENTFFLRAKKPYGVKDVSSPMFANGTFSVTFPVGASPVILTNKDTDSPIVGEVVRAYEILDDGTLKHRVKGTTDATGTVHFDLNLLSPDQPYIFRVKNTFGQNKKYYSERTTSTGITYFAIAADEDASLDLEAPEVAITSPATGSQVGQTGFELRGTATDNTEIDTVSVQLTQGENSSTHPATYTDIGDWSLSISADQISTGSLEIRVTATDNAGNSENTRASYNIVTDAMAPTLTIGSPSENSDVPVTGFLLQGTASDDTGIASLSAQILDRGSNEPINRNLTVSSNGNWSLAISNGQLTQGGTVSITLTLTDIVDKQTSQTISFNIIAASNEERHLINRITFGATPDLLDEVRRIGVDAYLNEQLAPDSIDDSVLTARLADNGDIFSNAELQRYQLTHMIHSRKQLKEVMAWFWENHFNTDIRKEGNDFSYELREHDLFRANALGNFRDLLDISAKSPAMLIYLDSIFNVRSDANENYAREVMELSTCGVDGCYIDEDIEALAEIFTGWQVQNDAFFFNNSEHTLESKQFLGATIAENGVEEGNTALDMLANHSATANYICSKLIKVFVNDTGDAGLNARCATTFQTAQNAPDQITQVLRVLLTSPEFNSDSNFNSKIKTPVEFAVGAARAVQAEINYDDLATYIRRMGIRLFFNPVPTGWDEEGTTWINSALLQERVRFVNQMASASNSNTTLVDPLAFLQSRNLDTADAIVAYLFDLLGGDIWTDLERQTALDILNENGIFDINATSASTQIHELIGTIQSYPEYNYQ